LQYASCGKILAPTSDEHLAIGAVDSVHVTLEETAKRTCVLASNSFINSTVVPRQSNPGHFTLRPTLQSPNLQCRSNRRNEISAWNVYKRISRNISTMKK